MILMQDREGVVPRLLGFRDSAAPDMMLGQDRGGVLYHGCKGLGTQQPL